jgi:hypothetical protein
VQTACLRLRKQEAVDGLGRPIDLVPIHREGFRSKHRVEGGRFLLRRCFVNGEGKKLPPLNEMQAGEVHEVKCRFIRDRFPRIHASGSSARIMPPKMPMQPMMPEAVRRSPTQM